MLVVFYLFVVVCCGVLCFELCCLVCVKLWFVVDVFVSLRCAMLLVCWCALSLIALTWSVYCDWCVCVVCACLCCRFCCVVLALL